MAKWRSPLTFLRWLLAGERLDAAAGPAPSNSSAPPRASFFRWLLSSEQLPDLEPVAPEEPNTSLFRLIFSSDRLPQDAPAASEKLPGGNNA